MNKAQLVLAAQQEVLQDLLEYEGGEMQSMQESFACHAHNTTIITYANKIGVQLDLSKTGRSP
jgi:hypothetical protein